VGRATGLDTGRRELERAGQGRQRVRLEFEPRPRRPGHLERVAEQPEAGHVRGGGDPRVDERLRGGPVEPAHAVDGG
jgi:hypothetical protein